LGSFSFIGRILMDNLSIIGQYIGISYEEIKRRPPYIVDTTKNI